MPKKKVNGVYDYKAMSIYFDISNPYQRECYELLQKINKKKSLFLGLLAHDFLRQFKDSSNITSEDLKNYIQFYDLMNKMDSPVSLSRKEKSSDVSAEKEKIYNTAPANNEDIYFQKSLAGGMENVPVRRTEDFGSPKEPEKKETPKQDSAPKDLNGLLSAMNMFSMSS